MGRVRVIPPPFHERPRVAEPEPEPVPIKPPPSPTNPPCWAECVCGALTFVWAEAIAHGRYNCRKCGETQDLAEAWERWRR